MLGIPAGYIVFALLDISANGGIRYDMLSQVAGLSMIMLCWCWRACCYSNVFTANVAVCLVWVTRAQSISFRLQRCVCHWKYCWLGTLLLFFGGAFVGLWVRSVSLVPAFGHVCWTSDTITLSAFYEMYQRKALLKSVWKQCLLGLFLCALVLMLVFLTFGLFVDWRLPMRTRAVMQLDRRAFIHSRLLSGDRLYLVVCQAIGLFIEVSL